MYLRRAFIFIFTIFIIKTMHVNYIKTRKYINIIERPISTNSMLTP